MGTPNKLTIIAACVHGLFDYGPAFRDASKEAKDKAIAVAEFLSGYAYGAATMNMKKFTDATADKLATIYGKDLAISPRSVVSIYLNIESALK